MSVFEASLTLYRKTIKRVRPVHVTLHRLMAGGVIPLLERLRNLETMPDDPFWFRLELLTRRHEPETVRQFERLLKPGMTVLDIGAHVGYYTRLCARQVGPGGRVIAFEPHPHTYQVLQHNIAGQENITALQLAVSDTEGTAELFDYLMMSASGSLHYDEALLARQKAQLAASDIAPRITNDFPVETFSVRTVPLDSCLAELGITRVDAVKMDIEGAEMAALRGMQAIIANSPGLALVMEYNPGALASAGDPSRIFDEVLGMGFDRVQVIETGGNLTDLTGNVTAIQQLTAELIDRLGVVNLLFTRV